MPSSCCSCMRLLLMMTLIKLLIRADIPDPAKEVKLYKLVSMFILHRPCGTANPDCPCMVNGICSKNFPKTLCQETHLLYNGYPDYRRSNRCHTIKKNSFVFDSKGVMFSCFFIPQVQNQHKCCWLLPYHQVPLQICPQGS